MSDKITVSIIIPVYKIPEEYLNQCIESILDQTFDNFEIILVDDNDNNDISGKLCDKLSFDHAKIISLHQKNQGVSVARNNGLLHAKGQWIAFVDSDDWLEPNYLKRLVQEGENHKADIVMCSCFANYINREKINEFFQYRTKLFTGKKKDEILLQLICRGINDYFPPETGVGVPWAKLYRKDYLEEKKLKFDSQLFRMQDNIFNLYAVEDADRIYYFNEILYHYRKNNGSATKKFNPKIVTYFEKVNEATEGFIRKHKKERLFYKALYAKTLIGFNSYINLYYWPVLRARQKRYRVIKEEIKGLLKKTMYQIALSKVDKHILNFQERIYVGLLRKKMIGALLFITLLNDFYKRLKNGSPEQ
ncbi:glycosyltransferase family 2 protein [Sporolactobacillus pectinivorans]|uniref:glycosyltransferase family 2 protein n=1 Tax=Sporolactobacillus pectinivorans TaxID=1591408 RepID=UPI000C26B03A|nr:glycosyltransferase [Sporolactobacillus pectinivorans]